MNVIDLLKSQHKEVEGLFSRYEGGDESVASTIIEKLELHTKIEETLVYPVIREYVPGGDDMIDHAETEHNMVKGLLLLFKVATGSKALFDKIKDDVTHHVEEEEGEVFPALQANCSSDYLDQLGTQAEQVTL